MSEPVRQLLAPDLEARIAAIEESTPSADFDSAGWFWMILLGLVLPLLLIAAGWWA